jgi:hypothetical protein
VRSVSQAFCVAKFASLLVGAIPSAPWVANLAAEVGSPCVAYVVLQWAFGSGVGGGRQQHTAVSVGHSGNAGPEGRFPLRVAYEVGSLGTH